MSQTNDSQKRHLSTAPFILFHRFTVSFAGWTACSLGATPRTSTAPVNAGASASGAHRPKPRFIARAKRLHEFPKTAFHSMQLRMQIFRNQNETRKLDYVFFLKIEFQFFGEKDPLSLDKYISKGFERKN